MAINHAYCNTEIELNGVKKEKIVWTKSDVKTEDRIYSYEEAISLAGNGWYNRVLLASLSLCLLGMAIDIFGFSIITTGCTCDFQLDLSQKSILMSTPFVGPIITAYIWGYLSDTQGRRKSLLIGMWGSFLASVISAFSPNWIVLAIMKIISTSFCSSAQSCTYTLLGESCAQKVRSFYMLIMTSALMLFLISYVVPGYFILNLTFELNVGLITFTPWRLLAIVLALPLCFSALGLHYCYESPKFLLNAGLEAESLGYLEWIWKRNGGIDEYPVKRIFLEEHNTTVRRDLPVLQSLWEQTIPLFKPPLLWRTLQMFYVTSVIYSINNSLVMWMPFMIEAFTAGVESTSSNSSRSLCAIIASTQDRNSTNVMVNCTSTVESRTVLSGITHGIVFAGITLCVSKLALRKKALLMAFLLIPLLSSLTAIYNENNIASLMLYVGMMMTNLCMGVLFVYYVDLYPTSHRGMAACLGVMVARVSGLAGVNFIGYYMMSHCTMTFYAFSVYLFSGIVVSYFLPSYRPL